jgi:hypothetical protein
MTKREQLLQELEHTSDDVFDSIIGIRKGLEEFDLGEDIPAAQALEDLQHRLNIPSRT